MICLVRPPAVEYFRLSTTVINLPIGLAYVAAALEAAGHKVEVIDAIGEAPDRRVRYFRGYLLGLHLDELANRVPEEAALVGISAQFTHEWPEVVRLVELIKRRRPDTKIALGGEHVTALPEFCLLTSRADFVVLGEGEETIVELVEALRSARPLTEVEGLAFRDSKEIIVNRRRERRKAVDDIPWPAWHHFDVRKYHERRFVFGAWTESLSVPILATRGCPYQCTYCSSPNMWTTQWIPRDPVRVVDEIEHYVHTLGARSFPLQDLTAIVKKDWIVAYCQEILRRELDITWQLPSGTRSEVIDEEVAALLARSGMVSMSYAPESGSEVVRRLIKKRMTSDRLFRSIRAASDAQLHVCAFMVIGFPHDNRQSILENEPFLERLAKEGVSDVSVGFYMALPGTELFYSLFDAGKLRIDRDYFRQTTQNLTVLPAKSFCESLTRAELAWLKIRLFVCFYWARRRAHRIQVPSSQFWRDLAGLRRGGQPSRLGTVFRSAASSVWNVVKTRFAPRWIPEEAEVLMFADWDTTYRSIRAQQLTAGRVSGVDLDPTRLHTSNFATTLRDAHRTAGVVAIAVS